MFTLKFDKEKYRQQKQLILAETQSGLELDKLVTFDDNKLEFQFHKGIQHSATIFPAFFMGIERIAEKVANDRYLISEWESHNANLEARAKAGKRIRTRDIMFATDNPINIIHNDVLNLRPIDLGYADETKKAARLALEQLTKIQIPIKGEINRSLNGSNFAIMQRILDSSKGLVIGERHQDILPKRVLIDPLILM